MDCQIDPNTKVCEMPMVFTTIVASQKKFFELPYQQIC